jgi:hypothetical protein
LLKKTSTYIYLTWIRSHDHYVLKRRR